MRHHPHTTTKPTCRGRTGTVLLVTTCIETNGEVEER